MVVTARYGLMGCDNMLTKQVMCFTGTCNSLLQNSAQARKWNKYQEDDTDQGYEQTVMNLSPLKELLDKGRSKVGGNEAMVEVGNSKTEIEKW